MILSGEAFDFKMDLSESNLSKYMFEYKQYKHIFISGLNKK